MANQKRPRFASAVPSAVQIVPIGDGSFFFLSGCPFRVTLLGCVLLTACRSCCGCVHSLFVGICVARSAGHKSTHERNDRKSFDIKAIRRQWTGHKALRAKQHMAPLKWQQPQQRLQRQQQIAAHYRTRMRTSRRIPQPRAIKVDLRLDQPTRKYANSRPRKAAAWHLHSL